MTLLRVSSAELENGIMGGILGSPRRGSPRCADNDLRTSLLRKQNQQSAGSRNTNTCASGDDDFSGVSTAPPKCTNPSTTRFRPAAPIKSPSAGGLRQTIMTIAGTVLVMSVLVLATLLALALIGPATVNYSPEPGTLASPGRHPALGAYRGAHLLAEGLASLAASLDTEAVQEYVPPKGYIRKALEATKLHMEKQTEDITQLQKFYDAEVARLNQAMEDQRLGYEQKLLTQKEVLSEVFGDDAMPDN